MPFLVLLLQRAKVTHRRIQLLHEWLDPPGEVLGLGDGLEPPGGPADVACHDVLRVREVVVDEP